MTVRNIAVPAEVLRGCAVWLGKLIADNGHKDSVAPRHAEWTLREVEALLYGRPDPKVDLIRRMESFIAGFEDDEAQDGVDELLADARAAIVQPDSLEATR